MGSLKKLLEKIKRNPKTVRFDELDMVLRRAGFERSQPRGGSSHYVYRKGNRKLVVPRRQPYILQAYVIRAIKHLEGVEVDEE
ncbi:MAG: toxin HicA [Armatimonadetes bacterium]|nr:toxin HicA [Armatimonadota bacterium]